MPFALVTIGLIMIVSGARDTYDAFGKQLVSDFTGPGNFTYWLAAIGAVGSLGYIPDFRTFSRTFMALILVVMVLAQKTGFFDRLTQALNTGPIAPAQNAQPTNSTLANDTARAQQVLTGKVNSDAATQARDQAPSTQGHSFGDILGGIGQFLFGGPAY